jgi:hypothetical protein
LFAGSELGTTGRDLYGVRFEFPLLPHSPSFRICCQYSDGCDANGSKTHFSDGAVVQTPQKVKPFGHHCRFYELSQISQFCPMSARVDLFFTRFEPPQKHNLPRISIKQGTQIDRKLRD